MLTKFNRIFLFLIIQVLASGFAYSQIYSPEADYSRIISYKSFTGNDSLFVFYENPHDSVSGSLLARAPSAGNYNFEWSKYNPDTNSFDPLPPTVNNVAESTRTGLPEGGYRVRIFNGSFDSTYMAWLFIDNLIVDIEETEDGRVKPFKYTCEFLILNGSVDPDTFIYYDPQSHESIQLLNGASFVWTSDNNELIIPNPTSVLDPNISYTPPFKDTWYILTASDSFGMMDRDSVFYESIQVKSEFSYQFFDKEEEEEFVDPPSPPEGGAPLEVKFINESQNGASFEWIFVDTIAADYFENEFTEDPDYTPEFTYYIPDKYFPALVATSEEGCVDTFKVEEAIHVLPSELEVPNVFTPNGDDINDYFTVSHKSIRSFSIWIYSRTGNLVYEADIPNLYEWDGWDGNIKNTDRPAAPGVYYYVIEAIGYDDEEYNFGIYRGAVHLFRGEKQ